MIIKNIALKVPELITNHSNRIMKRLFLILLTLSILGNIFVGCKDEETDFTEVVKDKYTRIFGQWPEKKNGKLGEFSVPLGNSLYVNIQYTPSQNSEAIWYVDGVEVHRGLGFSYTPEALGKYHLKLVVKTPKYETSREAIINVLTP